jgi:hypothetical protein
MTRPVRESAGGGRSRRIPRALVFAFATLGAGCTAADSLSSAEILTELDQIVRVEGSGDATEIGYAKRAAISPWYMRNVLTQPVRWPLMWIFGRSTQAELESPERHVRELVVELPDEVGGDLTTGALAVSRLGWIAEFERNAQTRLAALDALAAIAGDLGLELFRGDFQRFDSAPDPERIAVARASVQASRTAARGDERWDEARLRPYGEALSRLTEAPLPERDERLRLVEDLTALYTEERERAALPAVATALRAAIGHVVEAALLRVVTERTPEDVDLRLCAMEQVRRLGGPAVVPLLLAKMAASQAQVALGQPRYDGEPLVRLRLIHYCGQLREPLASTSVQLRRGWVADTPAEFLAYTALSESAYYSKLRTPALLALTWSLQRPQLETDVGWVNQWRESRR